MAVCCHRFSFIIKNCRWITAVTDSCKGCARSIAHTESGQFFNRQFCQIPFFFPFGNGRFCFRYSLLAALSIFLNIMNVLRCNKNYVLAGYIFVLFSYIQNRSHLCIVFFLCQKFNLTIVALCNIKAVCTLFCKDCFFYANQSFYKRISGRISHLQEIIA